MNKPRLALALCLSALVLSCGDDDSTGPGSEACEGTCLVVSNVSDLIIDDVRFSACGDDSWGTNRLGTAEIQPDGTHEWEVTAGCYDIQCTSHVGDWLCSVSHFSIDIAEDERYTEEFEGCPDAN